MTVFTGPVMQVPENAEPIFNPIKGLHDSLSVRKVSIAPILHIETGARLGHPGAHQFACTVQEDFPDLADKIAELGKVVRFITLFVPKKGVICAQTYQYGDVWARYVAAYDCPTDQMYGRWDVVVEPIHLPEQLRDRT